MVHERWTLQELTAPLKLVFYSNDWGLIGTRLNLYNVLSEITGINAGILSGVKNLESTSVAKRMSWASIRATTRAEDLSYCLMGLFVVNMPMLYGESAHQTARSNHETFRRSVFVRLVDLTAPPDSYRGLLATCPADFVNSGNIILYRGWEPRIPFSMSNKGLCFNLHLSHHEGDIYCSS